LDFSFADLLFRVTAQKGYLPLCPPDEYAPFMGSANGQTPEAIYEAILVPNIPAPFPTETIFWDNGIWRTRLTNSTGLEIDLFDIQLPGWRPAASVSEDFSSGDLFIPEPAPEATSIRPLYHPQDRAVILGRVCHIGGVMMHSSSVLIDGKVLIFAGMSGAGKTTLARLWRTHGATILNDERNLIHTRNGTVRSGASPWHGEENQVVPTTGPLAGIFFLNQAPTNRLHPLPLPESLPKMLTTAFIPVFIPGGPARTMEACHAILEGVPAYGMDFTPDVRALDLCRSVL
jgi:hypothetical protein